MTCDKIMSTACILTNFKVLFGRCEKRAIYACFIARVY